MNQTKEKCNYNLKEKAPKILSQCKYMNFINYLEMCQDILNFIENYQKSLMYGLESIIFYDSMIYDIDQEIKDIVQVSYFSDEFKKGNFPSIHLYLYEIFGCTIEPPYKKNIFGKIRKFLDLIYYHTFGKNFLIHKILIGLSYHRSHHFNLNFDNNRIEISANELFRQFKKQ